jgi:hypothetical protein
MKKLLLLLVAFSILNQSIDIDYCTTGTVAGDDIDSVYELVVENFIGDQNYTGEADNDDGTEPKNSQVQKDASSCLYCQELKVTPDAISELISLTTSRFISNMISKGHCLVTSPPPDPAFSC